MDQTRASVDIAYINAKTRVAIVLATGGMLTLLIGLTLLFFGVTSQDKTLMKLLGVEVSAGGLGGVIMTTSVMWAFFAYKTCPSYAHSSRVEEKFNPGPELLERLHFESSTQLLVESEAKLERPATKSATERLTPQQQAPRVIR